MSQTGISWGFGEVVSTQNAFNQKTDADQKKKRDSEGKAVGQDIADPKYRGEIEVTMTSNQGGIPGGLSGDTIVAYPADINYTRIPLVGEHVIMYQGPGANMGSSPPDTKTYRTENKSLNHKHMQIQNQVIHQLLIKNLHQED